MAIRKLRDRYQTDAKQFANDERARFDIGEHHLHGAIFLFFANTREHVADQKKAKTM